MENKSHSVSQSELLKLATALCNDMDELMVMHYYFYRAVEHYFPVNGLPVQRDLSLFPRWLREKDLEIQEAMHRLQGILRNSLN